VTGVTAGCATAGGLAARPCGLISGTARFEQKGPETRQSRRRPPTPDGFAFVSIVPCSRTASVGLSNRPVKQRAAGVHLVRALGRAVRPTKNSDSAVALKLRSVDNSRLIAGCDLDRCIVAQQPGGAIMAKRKKASKAQKRAKLRSSAKRGKARKAAKAAKATKRTIASAKPKPAPAKKAAQKVKQPVTPVVETVAVEVIEQPAPG